MTKIYYNPLDTRCKSVTGGIKQNEELTLTVFCQEEEISSDKFVLVINRDGENAKYLPMKRAAYGWYITLVVHTPGLFFYHFMLGTKKIGRGRLRDACYSDNPDCYQLTVYEEHFTTPAWFKGGIMYQIFPDRFCKVGDYPIGEGKIMRYDWGAVPIYRPDANGKVLNNDFFGGNFNGVRSKLSYLKELNVSVIYFNPIFESSSNHRYDTGDYMKIDNLLGTKEDFEKLVEEARALGMRVILDGVFNHTGDNSRYFNRYGQYDEVGAYQSFDSKYRDWYTFIRYPDVYESWWGIDTLPSVNEKSESYQNFIFGEDGVLKTWLKSGIGGYRLDVADELPDFFLKMLRKAVKSGDPDAVIIGEVWEDASNKIAYSERREYLQGDELDSVMNYPLKDAIINFVLTGNNLMLRETIHQLIDNYPKSVLDSLMNILGTHDTNRILTVLGEKSCHTKDEMSYTCMSDAEKAKAIEKLKMAVFLQYMLPGVPCIYYGDENAMEGYGDPFCRKCFDWRHLNEDLIAYYRKLGHIRTELLADILKDGTYKELIDDNHLFAFKRSKGDKAVYVFANKSDRVFYFHIDGEYRELLSGKVVTNGYRVDPDAYGALIKIES